MNPQQHAIETYRNAFLQHGDAPEALLWSSEGQQWRFEKLLDIAGFNKQKPDEGNSILEIGCGLGHLYPLLVEQYGAVNYTGIDIVPELIAHASANHPGAQFVCRDVIASPMEKQFDFVFISGVFNAPYRTDSKAFMEALLTSAFAACSKALCFNFTSTHVNFTSEDANYFDPQWVLSEALNKMSRNLEVHHHYRNCDVAVCVRR